MNAPLSPTLDRFASLTALHSAALGFHAAIAVLDRTVEGQERYPEHETARRCASAASLLAHFQVNALHDGDAPAFLHELPCLYDTLAIALARVEDKRPIPEITLSVILTEFMGMSDAAADAEAADAERKRMAEVMTRGRK